MVVSLEVSLVVCPIEPYVFHITGVTREKAVVMIVFKQKVNHVPN